MRKLTKRDYFNAIITVMEKVGMDVPVAIDEENSVIISSTDMIDFANREKDLLSRKSGAERKPTKTQIENEKIKELILIAMEEIGEPAQVKTIAKADTLANYTPNKLTALIGQLVKAERVRRTEEKGVALFSLIEVEDDED